MAVRWKHSEIMPTSYMLMTGGGVCMTSGQSSKACRRRAKMFWAGAWERTGIRTVAERRLVGRSRFSKRAFAIVLFGTVTRSPPSVSSRTARQFISVTMPSASSSTLTRSPTANGCSIPTAIVSGTPDGDTPISHHAAAASTAVFVPPRSEINSSALLPEAGCQPRPAPPRPARSAA